MSKLFFTISRQGFLSVFCGKIHSKSIHKLMGISMVLSTIFSGIFTIVAMLCPENIIAFFVKDSKVVQIGSDYLRIVCFSYVPMAIATVLSTANRNVHITVAPMVANEVSWVVGTTLYFVAYGRLGTSSVAAVQVSNSIFDFSWALFMGIGSASDKFIYMNDISYTGYIINRR